MLNSVDQPDINLALGSAPLTIEWRANLLDGVMAIKGKWADGSPLLAIPNFARENRILQESNRAPAGFTGLAESSIARGALIHRARQRLPHESRNGNE